MALTPAQQAAELQRKRNLGLKPTNSANLGVYNKLTPQQPKQGGIIPQGQEPVRDYLKSRNIDNGGIGFSNGRVTFGGGGSIKPATVVNGTSYAPLEDLDKAYNRYMLDKGRQGISGLMGDYEKAIDAPVTPYTPATPFTYNKDTDPAYQAALQSAMANAKTASNNALVSLGARGIGNSSSAVTAANQIEQNALGQVTRDVLPQLISQAYQRYADSENQRYRQYLDQYGMSQDRIGNIGNAIGLRSGENAALSAEDQRAIENALANRQEDFRERTDKRDFDRGVLENDRNFNRGVLESDRGFNRGVLESDRNFKRGALESDRSYGLQQADNNLARDRFNYEKGQDQAKKTEESKAKIDEEKAAMTDALRYGELTTEAAKTQIMNDLNEGYYTPEEAQELLNVLNTFTPTGTGGKSLTLPLQNPNPFK